MRLAHLDQIQAPSQYLVSVHSKQAFQILLNPGRGEKLAVVVIN